MTFLAADDFSLSMGLLLGILFSLTFLCGTIVVIKIVIKPKSNENRLHHIFYTAVTLIFFYDGLRITYREYNLLYNYYWVEGTLIDKCSSKGSGQSYEFEYYVEGKRYTNCNSSGNVKNIRFPNGKYKVRVSTNVPGSGRIDYNQEITNTTNFVR
ncbi:hypothetical protein [Ferruginibacter profundus]